MEVGEETTWEERLERNKIHLKFQLMRLGVARRGWLDIKWCEKCCERTWHEFSALTTDMDSRVVAALWFCVECSHLTDGRRPQGIEDYSDWVDWGTGEKVEPVFLNERGIESREPK